MSIKIEDLFYKEKIKVITLPRRQLSSDSEYPELIGLEGRITRISGNRVGVKVDGKYNEHSSYGCYWFEPECLEFI